MILTAGIVDSLIPWAAVSVILLLVGIGIALSQKMSKQLNAVKAAVIRRYGFTDHNPKGAIPKLTGTVSGLKACIDVIYVYYATGGNSNHKRPFTRVRVQLEDATGVVVRVRSKRFEMTPDWPEVQTGDLSFDERYVCYVKPGVLMEQVITDAVRQAFCRVNPTVALEDAFVSWIQPKLVRDARLMLDVVDCCNHIASVLPRR